MKRYIKNIMLMSLVSVVLPLGVNAEDINGEAQSLSLEECRTIAMEHNEKIKRANNALLQADLDRKIAFANYLPKLDGSVNSIYTKDIDMMGAELQIRGMWMAGLTIQQPIYAGGQITAANKLAGITRTIREEELRKSRQSLIADVDNAYYSLVAVGAKVKMVEALADQLQSLYDKVSLSVQAGLSTDAELLRIAAKQSEVQYQLQKVRNGRTMCQLSLASTLGLSLDDANIIPKDTVIAITAPTALDEDLSQRPDARLLEENVEVAKQQSKVARASMLPTVGMQLGMSWHGNMKMKGMAENEDGSYSPFSRNIHGNSPMAILSVQIPIFHWGAESRKYKKARIEVENATLKMQQELRGMRVEVRHAIHNLIDGYAMFQTAERGQQQADENLRIMRNRYEAQVSTMTDLLEAQAQWQQAHSNLIEAQTQYKIYETEYMRVTGKEGM